MTPPYVSSKRAAPKTYLYEWTNEQHEELAHILITCKSYIVLSGYNSGLYNELYPNWHMFEREAQTNTGGSKIETLWLSPKTYDALELQNSQYKQKDLFGDNL